MFIGKSNVRLSRKLKYLSLGVIAGLALAGFSGINLLFAAPPPGTGLEATYFNESNLTDPGATRVDSTVNFDWGTGPAIPSVIYGNTFSVRWTGHVRAEYSEAYTFYTRTDDGVRLWVNGQPLVDKWINQGQAVEWSGSINLVAGQSYDITMEYFENTQRAVAQLSWSSLSTPKAIVPQAVLYTPGTAPPSEDDIDYVSENLGSLPTSPEVGQNISFYADVRNQGTFDAPLSSNLVSRIDLNNDGGFDGTLPAQSTSPLTAGSSESENWTDAWVAVAGTHRFEVCADDEAVVTETNEANNCAVNLFIVSEPPPPPTTDYLAEALQSFPAGAYEGQAVSFAATVRNAGSLDSFSASDTSLRLDINDNGIYDLSFPSQPTSALAAGSSEAVNWADVWIAEVGTHRMQVCADELGSISESDETNNCTTAQFTVDS